MRAADPGKPAAGPGKPGADQAPGADEDTARHVAELTAEDRRHDRRLLWRELLAVLLVAALLTARALWLT